MLPDAKLADLQKVLRRERVTILMTWEHASITSNERVYIKVFRFIDTSDYMQLYPRLYRMPFPSPKTLQICERNLVYAKSDNTAAKTMLIIQHF